MKLFIGETFNIEHSTPNAQRTTNGSSAFFGCSMFPIPK